MRAGEFIGRWTGYGAIAGLVIGGVTGLVLGLTSHPRTAWFAVFEVAVPGGIVGALIGAFAGSVAYLVLRVARRVPTREAND